MSNYNAFTILTCLRNSLHCRGFDICEPFNVDLYNGLLTKYPLPAEVPKPLGVVIGNTKNIWPKFVSFIKANGIIKDPLDTFCKKTIQEAIDAVDCVRVQPYELRFDTNTPASGRFVHLQTAGHLAGFAFYDREVMWSVHREYGLWFVYRAALIFPRLSISSLRDPSHNYEATSSHSEDCERNRKEHIFVPNGTDMITSGSTNSSKCIEGSDADIIAMEPPPLLEPEVKREMLRLLEIASSEGWQNVETRLRIRDVCPIGRERWRYENEQLDFFFPRERTREQVLQSILNEKSSDDITRETTRTKDNEPDISKYST